MSKNNSVSRLRADYLRIKKDPVPYILAEPLCSNILEWYYVVRGPESSPYDGGFYVGRLVFPREYPFKPPSIYMLTPNGRFKTHTRLCLSISDFHPDTWNPAWNVSTILTGLLSFMLEKSPTLGSIESSDFEKRTFAVRSLEYNLRIPQFIELFPELAEQLKNKLEERKKVLNRLDNDSSESDSHVLRNEDGFMALNSVNGDHENMNEQNRFYSFFMNMFIFLGFAIFAFAVKYVILNIS